MAERRYRTAAAAALLLVAAVLVGSAPSPAAAGVLPLAIDVTTTDDVILSGEPVSLREAIAQANGVGVPVTVFLATDATYQLDLCGPTTETEDAAANATGDLDHVAAQDLVVLGDGATIEQTCAGHRILEHHVAGGTLDLQDVTLTGGDTRDIVGSHPGGAVRTDGPIELHRARLEGNAASPHGGAVSAEGPLTVDHSLLQDNVASDDGGAIDTLDDVTLISSTITGNVAGASGGGVRVGGHLIALNSTISRNRTADQGGGVWVDDGAELQNVTVVANRAPTGANVLVQDDALAAQSTIFALGSGGQDCDIQEDETDLGFNVSGDSSCFEGPTSPAYLHPMLGPLRDNGGDTPTYRPVVGSPVLDLAMPPCATNVDQRDAVRGPPPGGACDTGSVEAAPAACTQAFPDVGTGHPFFDEICWLVQSGITTGFQPGPTFKPSNPVTRQSMSAFLYRLALSPPVPPPPTPTFTDVGTSHLFRTEVEWLAFEQISTGYQPGPTFKPGVAVTRQSMSAFLFRLAGEPAFPVPTTPSFDDVTGAHPFYEEIEFMAFSGLSTGFSDGTYRPSQPVSRQAMAAFLQRIAEEGFLGGI